VTAKENIERLIEETEARLQDLEIQKKEELEKLRRLKSKKSQLENTSTKEKTMPIRLTQVYSCTNRCKSPCK